MTKPTDLSRSDDLDQIIRKRILDRAKALNVEVMERVAIAANDLDAGEHRAALGALDGIEQQLATIRSILLLLA